MTEKPTAKRRRATKSKAVAALAQPLTREQKLVENFRQNFEGWNDLTPVEQDRAVQNAVAYYSGPDPISVKVEKTEGGAYSIRSKKCEGAEQLKIAKAYASSSDDYCSTRHGDFVRYLSKADGEVTGKNMSAALSFMQTMDPANPAEALLLQQMYMTHDAAVRALSGFSGAKFVDGAQVYGNLAAKLLNITTRQAEAFAKLRRGGEQIVKHVHVDNRNGGQTVVTDTVVTGGGNGGRDT